MVSDAGVMLSDGEWPRVVTSTVPAWVIILASLRIMTMIRIIDSKRLGHHPRLYRGHSLQEPPLAPTDNIAAVGRLLLTSISDQSILCITA